METVVRSLLHPIALEKTPRLWRDVSSLTYTGSELPVFRWVRVVAVAVAIPNGSVFAMDNNLTTLSYRLFAGSIDGCLLRIRYNPGALGRRRRGRERSWMEHLVKTHQSGVGWCRLLACWS